MHWHHQFEELYTHRQSENMLPRRQAQILTTPTTDQENVNIHCKINLTAHERDLLIDCARWPPTQRYALLQSCRSLSVSRCGTSFSLRCPELSPGSSCDTSPSPAPCCLIWDPTQSAQPITTSSSWLPSTPTFLTRSSSSQHSDLQCGGRWDCCYVRCQLYGSSSRSTVSSCFLTALRAVTITSIFSSEASRLSFVCSPLGQCTSASQTRTSRFDMISKSCVALRPGASPASLCVRLYSDSKVIPSTFPTLNLLKLLAFTAPCSVKAISDPDLPWCPTYTAGMKADSSRHDDQHVKQQLSPRFSLQTPPLVCPSVFLWAAEWPSTVWTVSWGLHNGIQANKQDFASILKLYRSSVEVLSVLNWPFTLCRATVSDRRFLSYTLHTWQTFRNSFFQSFDGFIVAFHQNSLVS